MVSVLFDQYVRLLEYCNQGTVERKTFQMMCNNYTDVYKRMSVGDQGELSELISEYLKER